MAHPHQKTAGAAGCQSFKHALVVFIVYHLRRAAKIFQRKCFSRLMYHFQYIRLIGAEYRVLGVRLLTLDLVLGNIKVPAQIAFERLHICICRSVHMVCPVMERPDLTDRPEVFRRYKLPEALKGRHIRYATLAAQHRRSHITKVLLDALPASRFGQRIPTPAAHGQKSRIGYVIPCTIQFHRQFPETLVKLLRRVPFVPAAVNDKGGMGTVFPYLVRRVLQEHFGIIGIRPVHRVGQPEIIPYHNSVLVAGLIKRRMVCHPHPVADHIQICFPVQADLIVVILRAVKLQAVIHTPVSALCHYPASIAIKGQKPSVN